LGIIHLILGDINRIHGQEQGYVIPEAKMALTNAWFWFVKNQDYEKLSSARQLAIQS
jgi:hypothetical protein